MNIISKARDFAYNAHKDQYRNDGITPYFNHVEQVAMTIQEKRDNECIVAAAYLHDCIEDGKSDYETIKKEFGEEVARIVDILTHRTDESYEDYIHKIITKDYYDVIDIKVVDILCNLSDSPSKNQVKKYADALKQFWRYA